MEPIILRVLAPLVLAVLVVASQIVEQIDELDILVVCNFHQLPGEVLVYDIWVDLTPVSWAVETWQSWRRGNHINMGPWIEKLELLDVRLVVCLKSSVVLIPIFNFGIARPQ